MPVTPYVTAGRQECHSNRWFLKRWRTEKYLKVFFNPSGIDVWVEKNKTEIIKIPAGMTVTVK